MVVCPERGADCLHVVQLMPLHPKTPSSLASFKSRLVLRFWYQLTQVVVEKSVMSVSVCQSLCLSVHLHISQLHVQSSTIFVHVAPICGSILLWRLCDVLSLTEYVLAVL